MKRRADGRYRASATLPDGTGTRRRVDFYGATAKAARAARDAAVAAGRRDSAERLDAYLARWLRDVVAVTCRPTVAARYAGVVAGHLVPVFGRTPLAQLRAPDVQALIRALLAAGLAPHTVRNIVGVLSSALGQAYRWGLVPANVARAASLPRLVPDARAPWTPAQVAHFLATAARLDDRLLGLYQLALALGLRQGELLALRWADVDLAAGTLTVTGSMQPIGGHLVRTEPKTARAWRTLPLAPAVLAGLAAQRTRQAADRARAAGAWEEHDLCFPSSFGTPSGSSNVGARFHQTQRAAGVPPIPFHELRHLCATRLAAAGTPLPVIMAILGHTAVPMSLRYIHLPGLEELRGPLAQVAGLLDPLGD